MMNAMLLSSRSATKERQVDADSVLVHGTSNLATYYIKLVPVEMFAVFLSVLCILSFKVSSLIFRMNELLLEPDIVQRVIVGLCELFPGLSRSFSFFWF